MSLSLSPPEREAVVSRLRAAGCVFAEEEAELVIGEATATADLDAMVARRVAGEPLEQVLGWAEFCGLRVAVVAGVFVPRRRTELLVDVAVASMSAGDRVLDLCCGCGAIGLAIAARVPYLELHAAELDPVAAACAQRNLGDVPVYIGDLFDAVPDRFLGRYDVIAANVPYVPTADIALMPAEAHHHEPGVALDGGPDGLDVLRRVAADAARWLRPGGCLVVEISDRQAGDAVAAFDHSGLSPRIHRDVERGATVVAAVTGNDAGHALR
jgi:release factor glutamine methyltransferase